MCNLTVEREGYGWVVRRDGEKVYGAVSARWRAEDALERMQREARLKERPCIRCSETFMSEGPHHRMCTACRAFASDVFDGAV